VTISVPYHEMTTAERAALDRPEPQPDTILGRLRQRILTAEQVENLPPPEWLIDGYLVRNTLAVVYGKPGGGKSFTALDWAASVVTGSWWFGRQVRKGAVLYVAAEGLEGLGKRLRAWKDRNHHHSNLDGLRFVAGPVSLLDAVAVTALAQVVDEMQPELIILDTLSRSMPGGDENGPKDMSRVVDHLDQLRARNGATVLAVHHTPKADDSLRGHTILEGGVHTTIACRGAEGRIRLTVAKQKDDAKPQPLNLYLVPVADSCALSDRPGPSTPGVLTDQALKLLELLEMAALDAGLSHSEWFALASDSGISRTSYYDHRRTLIDTKRVRESEGSGRPRFFPVTSTNTNEEEAEWEEF